MRKASQEMPSMVYVPRAYQPLPGQAGSHEGGIRASGGGYGQHPVDPTQEPANPDAFHPAPPPPLAPHFHPSPLTSYHPWISSAFRPPSDPLHSLNSPMHQPPPGVSPYQYGFPFYGPRAPSFFSPYMRYRISWPPPGFGGHPPQGYYGLNTGYSSGVGTSAAYRCDSPSGVTGVSTLVLPPSSPPSEPSSSNMNQVSFSAQPTSGK